MKASLRELTVLALDALPQAVLIVEAGGKVLVRNAAAKELLCPGEDLAGLLDGEAAKGMIDWPAELASLADAPGGISRRNLPISALGGRQTVVDVCLRPLNLEGLRDRDSWSEQAGAGLVIVTLEDVSWRVSIERRLAISERLAATGAVAAKVAHELNNPLDGILRYIGLAERTAGQHAAQYLGKAREGLMRMAAIIRELIHSGGKPGPGAERSPVPKLLAEAVGVMQPRADAMGVAVMCDLAHCDDLAVDGSVFQVFCNVIKNALDAMSAGGLLSIRLRRCDGGCRIDFEDEGCGITAQQAEMMFEPFYTTKPAGQGAGLGLAICREILSATGGRIEAAPREQGGTRITVHLPAGEPAATLR